MTRLAFKDAADGYYEIDHEDGQPLPEWIERQGLVPCEPQTVTPAAVARVVSMRQARLALLSMGLLDDVEAAINTLPEPQQTAARIEWEYATEVRSDNPTVVLLAGQIGLDLDHLFETAGGIA